MTNKTLNHTYHYACYMYMYYPYSYHVGQPEVSLTTPDANINLNNSHLTNHRLGTSCGLGLGLRGRESIW